MGGVKTDPKMLTFHLRSFAHEGQSGSVRAMIAAATGWGRLRQCPYFHTWACTHMGERGI